MTEAETETGTETEGLTESEPETEAESETETEAVTEAESETEGKTETETETEGLIEETEVETEADILLQTLETETEQEIDKMAEEVSFKPVYVKKVNEEGADLSGTRLSLIATENIIPKTDVTINNGKEDGKEITFKAGDIAYEKGEVIYTWHTTPEQPETNISPYLILGGKYQVREDTELEGYKVADPVDFSVTEKGEILGTDGKEIEKPYNYCNKRTFRTGISGTDYRICRIDTDLAAENVDFHRQN